MQTHAEAIEFLRAAGVSASRREWVLGDTIVVPLGHPSLRNGSNVHPGVAWLVPSEGAWRLEQSVGQASRTQRFPDLEAACAAAVELAEAFAQTQPCHRCGQAAKLSFGERRAPGTLQYWVAAYCEACGAQFESDGTGPLPEELRQLELRRQGAWAVRVERPTTAAQWAALRSALDLSLSELAELKGSLPGGVFTGTFAEAQRLQAALADIPATVEPNGALQDDLRPRPSRD